MEFAERWRPPHVAAVLHRASGETARAGRRRRRRTSGGADNAAVPAGCDCETTIDGSLSSGDTYTADETAGEITVGTGGDERTYDYCVEDGDLRFRDTTADETERGVQALTLATSS